MAKLVQVAPSWEKLILDGLLCPLVGQETAECVPVIFVPWDPKQHILHPFTGIYTHCFAAAHQRVYDSGTDGGILIPTEQEVFPAQSQRSDGILHKVVVNAEALVIHIATKPWQ